MNDLETLTDNLFALAKRHASAGQETLLLTAPDHRAIDQLMAQLAGRRSGDEYPRTRSLITPYGVITLVSC